jgi:trans-2,3-dihydro-3-hydroxyanthranilate isomerase
VRGEVNAPVENALATLVLEEGIGPVKVEVTQEGANLSARFALEQAIERPPDAPAADHVAQALSLPKDAIVETWFAGLGVRFAFVRLKDDKAVDRAALDRGAWARHFASAWASNLYMLAGDVSPGSKLYVRMFAPALGIDEDPATGSGAAVLAGCLAERAGRDGVHAWCIAQGIALGRPSAIDASAERRAGRVAKIWVGGATVIMAEGTIRVPEDY